MLITIKAMDMKAICIFSSC